MTKPSDIADEVASDLAAQGALAATLMGSYARGTEMRYSDIDIVAVGDGPRYRLEHRHGMLVAVSWTTVERFERDIGQPESAGLTVQGWRDCRILYDPDCIAAMLKRQAGRWTWDDIGDERCNAYVADQLTGYAEEVHKLVNLLDGGNLAAAAVQRNVLATRMAPILAVHFRLLYASENWLWDDVGVLAGDRWRTVQERALGVTGEPFPETCRAALGLFVRTAKILEPLFDDRQRAVVDAACGVVEQVRLANQS